MTPADRLSASAMVDTVYRKRHADREEEIKFVSSSRFWHRYVDQGEDAWGAPNPYRMRQDSSFELDWGSGDVFLCQFLESSSQFVEINPRQIFYWELYTSHYSDRGSTSA